MNTGHRAGVATAALREGFRYDEHGGKCLFGLDGAPQPGAGESASGGKSATDIIITSS